MVIFYLDNKACLNLRIVLHLPHLLYLANAKDETIAVNNEWYGASCCAAWPISENGLSLAFLPLSPC
jgi:hypothetical protein